MLNVYDLVTEFHTLYEQPIRTEPSVDVPESSLRINMQKSEMAELFTAALNLDEVEIADALADIVYIIEGSALTFGLGPVEVVTYDSITNLGEMTLFLNHAFITYMEALDNIDTEYVRALLSVMKSACYFIASKLGYSLDDVIEVVHKSNLTKMGEDGRPVYITEGPEKGKATKGPNYVPPTADIQEILNSRESTGAES